MLTAVTCKAHAASGAVSALQSLAEQWETGWHEPSALIVFTYLFITNVEKDAVNSKRENKAQLHRHKSELQFRLQWTWTWNGQKYLLVYFHFSFERFPLFQSNWVVPSTQWSSCSSSFIIYCISKDPANSLIMWCSALYMLYHCDRTKSCVYLCCSWGMPLV